MTVKKADRLPVCVRKRAVYKCGSGDNNVNEDKDRNMKTKKKVSLLDFYREEGRQLDLVNYPRLKSQA